MKSSALVVLSGGQDSTTCLFWAKREFAAVHAVTFDYAQRHKRELEAASIVARMAGVETHETVSLGPVLAGTSPLTNPAEAVGHYESPDALPGGLEATFVPGRNILFATLAGNRAYILNTTNIVMGLCEEDYGGYHDCRQNFVQVMQSALSIGLYGEYGRISIRTPLMKLTKKQTVQLAESLPGCMAALAFSHTCYDGCYPPNPHNHASILRAKGFAEAQTPDPLIQRGILEGVLPADYPTSGLVAGTKYALNK
jgi:7-cyano-7-deazaguanine synthase